MCLAQGPQCRYCSYECRQYLLFNFFLTNGDFLHVLTAFSNRLDPYQARYWVGADLDPKRLTLRKTGPRSAVGNVACLTAVPGVASSIPTRSHTFVEINHETIFKVILLPSAESFKKSCCQLQAKVCARSTGQPLVQACPGKSVVR